MKYDRTWKHFICLLCIGMCTAYMTACDDDNNNPLPPEPSAVPAYKLLTLVPNSDLTSGYYLQPLDTPDAAGVINNNNATELRAASGAGAFAHNGQFFLNDYSNTYKIEKWDISSSGELEKLGDLSTADLGYAGNIYIRDETTGFVGASNMFKIAIFNPSTMQRTGFIDLSALSKLGQVTDFPTPGATIQAQAVAEVIVRGNYLFAGVYYYDNIPTYTPLKDGCYIIVVDLTKVNPNDNSNAAAVVKEISDPRGSYTGAWNSGVGSDFMIADENDDIYVLCHNMWAGHRATTGKPACVLRIRNGETEFDDDYYYDLETASAGNGNPVIGLEYHKDGKFYAAAMDPAQIDPDNPFSYYVDPIFKWWRFDLYNPAAPASIVNTDTYCKAAWATNCFFEGDYAYIPFANTTETYMLRVNTNSLAQTKAFSTNGTPFLFKDN